MSVTLHPKTAEVMARRAAEAEQRVVIVGIKLPLGAVANLIAQVAFIVGLLVVGSWFVATYARYVLGE